MIFNNKKGKEYAILAIVAIVAIVALLIMLPGTSKVGEITGASVFDDDDEEEEDDETCSPGFDCIPGDDDGPCPAGFDCECNDDDDECELKECELSGDDDDNDGICAKPDCGSDGFCNELCAAGEDPDCASTDHFKCYQTRQGVPVNRLVLLRDQFDDVAQETEVIQAVKFCNPVEKTHRGDVTRIQKENNHLIFYSISTSVGPPKVVTADNQFGVQELNVLQPVFLALPTEKSGFGAPTNLDHFKCYQATGAPVSARVDLNDQFHGEPGVLVFEPKLFCNPVEKIHGGVTPIQNPVDHLVCYNIRGNPFAAQVQARNQFGPQNLIVESADLLCVPSLKLAVMPLKKMGAS